MSKGAASTEVFGTVNELGAISAPRCINSTVAVGAASVQSNVFNVRTTLIRVVSTVDCFIVVDANPTASAANGIFLPAGTVNFFGVEGGIEGGQRLAVIRLTTSGSLYIMEGGA